MVAVRGALLLSLCCGILAVILTAGTARAQGTPGLTDKEVKIGSCSALEGPSQFLGTQTVLGASTYFQVINDEGGVHGRKLKLITRDDSYDPEKVQACFNSLMDEKVFAMGFFVGTPTAVKYVPLVDTNKIPAVGWFTGAQALSVPFHRYIINVRTSYYDETREQVDGLWNTLGYRKIGVIYPEDPFGTTVLEGVKIALRKHDSSPVAEASFPRQTGQVDNAIDSVRGANPDAVVLVGPYAPVATILKKAHAKGWKPMFLTVSFVGTDELIKEGGADAEGMVITQVVPPYYLTDLKGVALYRRSMQKYHPGVEPSFVSLEGFVDAMVLVEGLKRAGRELTREKLIQAIESIHDFDVGLGPALRLNYSAKEHRGFTHVIPTVVRGGRAVPFADWSIAKPQH